MSDPISPAGSQGVAAQANTYNSPISSGPPGATGATPSSAEAQAINEAAQASQAVKAAEASTVELSAQAGAGLSQKAAPTTMTMEQAAQAFQSYLSSLPSNLELQPDYQAGIVVFRVVNPVTQKVIRQLPPEEVVNQAKNLRMAQKEGHSGILLDQSL